MRYWRRLSEPRRDWKCHIVETVPSRREVSPTGRWGLLSPRPPASGPRSGPGTVPLPGLAGRLGLRGSVLSAAPAPLAPLLVSCRRVQDLGAESGGRGRARPCLECRPEFCFSWRRRTRRLTFPAPAGAALGGRRPGSAVFLEGASLLWALLACSRSGAQSRGAPGPRWC